MKIVDKKDGLVVKEFKDLKPGDVFRVERDLATYLKKSELDEEGLDHDEETIYINAISLSDYEDWYFAPTVMCTVYDAELIITLGKEEE